MSHQDRNRMTGPQTGPQAEFQASQRADSGKGAGGDLPQLNSVYLGQALQWILSRVDWKSVEFRKDCSWTPRWHVAAALLWAWSDEGTLGERFLPRVVWSTMSIRRSRARGR